MPIYEYECRSCGHRFEFLKLPSSVAVDSCPTCRGTDLERLISMFSPSSDASRAQAKSDGRGRAGKLRREQAHAEAEYMKNHRD